MVITENHIRKIVSESLRNLLMELNIGVIGRSGPLTVANMVDPNKVFPREREMGKEIFQKKQENPRYRVNLDKVFADSKAYWIYKNYYNAMMSKPGKKAVKFIDWIHFLCDGKKGQPMYGFKVDDNYLFGMWVDGYFLSVYFCPANPMGMFRLISEIAQYNNIIFAVTQDMSPMLERLGIPKAEETHDAPWRRKVVTKDVFGTSQEAIKKGLEILDRGVEIQNVEKGVKNMGNDDIKGFMEKFNMLNPEQKNELRGKLGGILKQKYPDLYKKFNENGTRG